MIYGKKEAVELLEAYLKRAKEGNFGHAAVCLTGMQTGAEGGVAACDFAGELSLELCTREALQILLDRITGTIDKWMLPPQDPSLNHSFVRYNLANGPLGFDFATWIITQEMIRIKNGAPAPLKVAFWCGKDAEDRMKTAGRQPWLDMVFRPIIKLLGAVEDDRAVHGHHIATFVPRTLVDAFRNDGVSIPKFRATKSSSFPGVVTITLREKKADTGRNSDNDEWLKFAKYLQDQGEKVIIVRDTEFAEEPLEGFQTYPEASIDLETRFALYNEAKMNFFVENGPAVLGIYSDYPWVQFCNMDGSERLRSPEFQEWAYHFKVGEQYPWSKPNQRIVWKPATYEAMVEAWEACTTQQ